MKHEYFIRSTDYVIFNVDGGKWSFGAMTAFVPFPELSRPANLHDVTQSCNCYSRSPLSSLTTCCWTWKAMLSMREIHNSKLQLPA